MVLQLYLDFIFIQMDLSPHVSFISQISHLPLPMVSALLFGPCGFAHGQRAGVWSVRLWQQRQLAVTLWRRPWIPGSGDSGRFLHYEMNKHGTFYRQRLGDNDNMNVHMFRETTQMD